MVIIHKGFSVLYKVEQGEKNAPDTLWVHVLFREKKTNIKVKLSNTQ